MAITLGAAATPTAPAADANGKPKRPPAKYWANIVRDALDPNTGEPTLIGLPFGIGLDNMEVKPAGGSKLMQAKNEFLKELIEAAASFEPGQEEIVLNLKVQLRRVSEHEAATAANNGYIASMTKLQFAPKQSA
jgi:hypothetical protein